MATVRVRYRSGETDEWTLNDQMKPDVVVKALTRMIMNSFPGVSFGVAVEHEQTPADYGFVGLRNDELASWHIDGLLEESGMLGPWLEAQDMTEPSPPNS